MGQVVAANSPDLIDEGFGRALDAAEAIAAMSGSTVVITAAIEDAAEAAAVETVAERPAGRTEPAAG